MTTRRGFFGALAGSAIGAALGLPLAHASAYPPVRTVPLYNVEDPRSATADPAEPVVGEVIRYSIPRWAGEGSGDCEWMREWAARTYNVCVGEHWRSVGVDHRPTWAEVREILATARKVA